jgi:AcrR family transcriptional regulator
MAGAKKKKSASELLTAGLTAIANSGIDRVTVTDVTEISQVSRPTFYTYYGDIHGYFAEMWLHFGVDWLNVQVGKPLPESIGISGELAVQEFDQAILEIFVAARRIPELREVVEPDLEAWWKNQTANETAKELNLSWKLAVILGQKLSSNVSKKSELALAFLYAFDVSDDWQKDPRFAELLSTPKTEFELSPLDLGENDVESHLSAAAVAVVAASGVANASMTRVARRARLSTGSVYPRFKNVETLIERSFAKVMERLIAANIQLAKSRGRSLESYGTFVNAGLLPGRKIWRNFRSEMHLEAMHSKEIAQLMAPAFTATAQQLQADIVREHVPDHLAEAASWLMHDQAIGISVLFGLLPRIGDLDHRVMLLNLNKHLHK